MFKKRKQRRQEYEKRIQAERERAEREQAERERAEREMAEVLKKRAEELNAANSGIIPIVFAFNTEPFLRHSFAYSQGKRETQCVYDGIQQFVDDIRRDEFLANTVEIAVCTPDGRYPFYAVKNFQNVTMEGGLSKKCMADTFNNVFRLLSEMKGKWSTYNIKYSQPLVVIISDCGAIPFEAINYSWDEEYERYYRASYLEQMEINFNFDGENYTLKREKDYWLNAKKQVVEADANEELFVIPLLVSESTNKNYTEALEQMKSFTNYNRCIEIGNGKSQVSFRDFFKLLSRSVSESNVNLLFSQASYASGADGYVRYTKVIDDFGVQDNVEKNCENDFASADSEYKSEFSEDWDNI